MVLVLSRNGSRTESSGYLDTRYEKFPTYAVCATNISIAATPTDVFSITGAIGKTVKIRNITISGAASALTHSNIVLIKRSTNNSGTSTAIIPVPLDSQNPPSTSHAYAYTANPTLGILVGQVLSFEYAYAAAATQVSDIRQFTFGEQNDQLIVLRDNNECLCVNLNSATITGGTIDVSMIYREETSV